MTPEEDDPAGSGSTRDDRLVDLEEAELRRVESHHLDRRFELFEAILLSIAAILAAWTGFQSAKWSGVQANSYSQAGATRVESTRSSTRAGQESIVDVITFTQWLQAAQEEGRLDRVEETDGVYVPDITSLSGFLYERFRPEFQVAVDAWLATGPTSSGAPATPFAMPEYQLESAEVAAELEQEAEAFAATARAANQRSDNYVLMTIMFATVLFFAGISSKMDTFRARVFLLTAGTTVLIIAAIVVATFPREL